MTTPTVSALERSLTALAAVAARAGLDPAAARDEGLRVSAALAESAAGAAAEWAQAGRPGTTDLAEQNRAFFDAASRGRRWRQHPTALLDELAQTGHPVATDYATALTEVAAAACTLGEPSVTVTANAAAASAAYLSAAQAVDDAITRVGIPSSGPSVQRPVPPSPSSEREVPPTDRDFGLTRRFGDSSGPGVHRSGSYGLPPLPSGPGTDAVLRSWGFDLPGPAGAAPDDGSQPSGIPAEASPTAAEGGPAEPAPPEPAEPEPTVDELLAELDAMIGLGRVKKEVHRQVALLTVEKLRVEAGLKQTRLSRHLIFVGNPGTGKTTVARLIGAIYKALGLLPQGQLVEVDRSELVAGYVGQTAIKTAEVCAKAVGGVLFIDEAYGLTGDQYAQEAVNTLVKEMEDHREDLVLIVAGYPDPMVEFIASNPGLASRFTTTIEFDDYTDDELMAILTAIAEGSDYELTEDAERRVRHIFEATPRTPAFGNGRFSRNLFEAAVGRHAWRLRDAMEPTRDELRLLTAADFSDETATDEPAADEPAADQPVADQPTADEPTQNDGAAQSEPTTGSDDHDEDRWT